MSDFRFAQPQWIHLIWAVLAIAGILIWLEFRGSQILDRFVSRLMQARMVMRPSRTSRLLSLACLVLAAICAVLAIMRPQWGLTYRKLPRVGAQLIVCLDVSKSMLAEDVVPNRLERAKAELVDLLTFLDGDQVGLIGFAGSARVLCPMTPDFGFLRLMLENASPTSVGRGGTRLAEPIDKALQGFRTEGDVSRVILLITDGEDHESFPEDAAKRAAERGVKIISIGFGDEAGSRIEYTDPRTGTRQSVLDADGRPVVSRLDGELLRQLALITEGAYVPAGTGALDLKSIYDQHIASLMRAEQDSRGRPIRNEAFQWAIVAALSFMMLGFAAQGSQLGSTTPRPSTRQAVVGGLAWLLFAMPLAAQTTPPQAVTESRPEAVNASPDATPAKRVTAADPDAQAPEFPDARAAYNAALEKMSSDRGQAAEWLEAARRDAGTDGEVRYRCSYNLGWIEAALADDDLEADPQAALEHLQRSADWFRDAIRLRNDSLDARHNLDVVLRRALELADRLREQQRGDLGQQIDQLIEQQRAILAEASGLVVGPEATQALGPREKSVFRGVAVKQRQTLSDSEATARTAGEELDSLRQKMTAAQNKNPNQNNNAQLSPEEMSRAVQLTQVLTHLDQARQRMGQARSQLRRQQAERAFRRSSAALEELKQAKDPLRNPVEVLAELVGEASECVQAIGTLQQVTPPPPAWLNVEYLQDKQAVMLQRNQQLLERFEAYANQDPAQTSNPGQVTEQQAQQQAEQQQFQEQVKEALPWIRQAQDSLQSAEQSLATPDFLAARSQQVEALQALQEARERFLDLKGLIELAYQTQTQVQALVAAPELQVNAGDEASSTEESSLDQPQPQPGQNPDLPSQNQDATQQQGVPDQQTRPQPSGEVEPAAQGQPDKPGQADAAADPIADVEALRVATLSFAMQLQEKNRQRGIRLLQMLQTQLDRLAEVETSESDSQPPVDPAGAEDATNPEKQRLELAIPLAQKANAAIENAMREFKALESARPDSDTVAVLSATRPHVDEAQRHLKELRRLFFTIVEHLRETAQRQAELNDQTQAASAEPEPPQQRDQIQPLLPTQQELQLLADDISKALMEQAEQTEAQASQAANAQPESGGAANTQEMAERLGEASQLVGAAAEDLRSAADKMVAEPFELPAVREQQDLGLQKLIEALQRLNPPQDNQQQNQQDQQQQQQDEQQQDQQQQDQQTRDQQQATAAQMLQAVRDREAERQKRKARQGVMRGSVGKDW